MINELCVYVCIFRLHGTYHIWRCGIYEIYDTILWYYVWWYLTEYMDWIWEVQNSDSLTAGGSAKIGVKLTREAMEARDLAKTLQRLHRKWKWTWCFSKNRISSWNWAQFSVSLGQPVGYHCRIWWSIYFEILKEVTEMAMIETIVRCPSRSVVLIRCIHQPDQEEGATVGPVYAMYYPKVGHCLCAMNIRCFIPVLSL